MTRPGDWLTNDPHAAALLRAADIRWRAARILAECLPLAEKIEAFRAANIRLSNDYLEVKGVI